jgi:hypothetical protein
MNFLKEQHLIAFMENRCPIFLLLFTFSLLECIICISSYHHTNAGTCSSVIVGDGNYAVGSLHWENASVFGSAILAANPQTVTYVQQSLSSESVTLLVKKAANTMWALRDYHSYLLQIT